MSTKIWWVVLVAALGGVAVALYYGFTGGADRPPAAQTRPVDTPAAPPPAAEEPEIRYPIPETAPEADEQPQALPPLAESDPAVRDALAGLFGEEAARELLVPENIARRIVATVDNLPRRKLAVQSRPVVPAPGRFLVEGSEDDPVLSPANFERYAPAVRMIEQVSAEQIAALYLRLYPLFQRAYADLGYPSAYFNDRLVEVIDHLLATPEVEGPIRLVQPRVFYEFADPELEALSAGQKLLIRMGPENAAVVKRKLRELRAEIVRDDAAR